MRRVARIGTSALSAILGVGWLLLGTPAQAAPIFSYSVTSPSTITHGGSSVSFVGGSGTNKDAGFPGGTNILTMTTTISSTTSSGFDTFNDPVSFTLTINDGTSTHNIVFSGTINGNVNNSNSSVSYGGFTTSPVTFTMNGYQYTVSFATPVLGSLGANTFSVKVSATAITPVPEPASLALWGLIGLGGAWYARRRTRTPASAA
jgi:hypothetical protein